MVRNGYVEVFRFLLSLCIAWGHFASTYVPSRFFVAHFMAVEAFFVMSGFFMMFSLSSHPQGASIIQDTWQFIAKKWKKLYIAFLACYITSFVIRAIFGADTWSLTDRLLYSVGELGLLQAVGLPGYYATGVAWYLSALFWGEFILVPCFLKWGKGMFYWALLFIVFGLQLIFHESHPIGEVYYFIFGFLWKGLLIGLVGLLVGAYSFKLCTYLKSFSWNIQGRRMLSLLELFCYVMTLMCLVYSQNGFVILFVLVLSALAVAVSMSGCSSIAHKWDGAVTMFLGKLSLFIYLSHFCWVFVFKKAPYMLHVFPGTETFNYVVLVTLSTAFNMVFATVLGRYFRWFKGRATNYLIENSK